MASTERYVEHSRPFDSMEKKKMKIIWLCVRILVENEKQNEKVIEGEVEGKVMEIKLSKWIWKWRMTSVKHNKLVL